MGRMTLVQTLRHLDRLPLALALWWFIEEVADEAPNRNAVFFYLRERVREERDSWAA